MDLDLQGFNSDDAFQELCAEKLVSVEGGSWARKSYLKSTIFNNMSTIFTETTPPNEPNAERVTEAAQNIMGAITEMRELSRSRWSWNSRNW